jgi:hypothetical protein
LSSVPDFGAPIGERIAKREHDLAAARLQEIEVLDRSLGCLHRCLDVRHRLADVVGERAAEQVTDAAGPVGQHVDELFSGRRRRGGERQRQALQAKIQDRSSSILLRRSVAPARAGAGAQVLPPCSSFALGTPGARDYSAMAVAGRLRAGVRPFHANAPRNSMRTVDQLFERYGGYYRHPANKAIH